MLPDLSPAHIMIVVVVALIVVGPKDLPMLLRKIGQFVGKMRGMANEFRASFDEMARQSELDELRKEVEAMRAAGQAAVPSVQDLGLDKALSTDAESNYITQWQEAQSGPPQMGPLPTPSAIPDDPFAVQPEPAPAAPKPRSRARKPAAAADGGLADDAPAAKPRARKSKTAPEADA